MAELISSRIISIKCFESTREILDCLEITSGKGVEVRGFGVFYKRHRKGRIGINPKTGEKTEVSEKFVPFFKPGKLLKEAVNKG